MTSRLQSAFKEAEKLPASEQDAFGDWILHELLSERRWAEAFANSQSALSALAREALDEYRAGETEPMRYDS